MGCVLAVCSQVPLRALGQLAKEGGLSPRVGKDGLRFSCSLWTAKNETCVLLCCYD